MQSDSGQTTSIWMATSTEIASDGELKSNARANVCVVGAGIAGMTTAYLLARAGKKVIVLDDGPIGGTMTARTTAHLVTALDDRFYELERLHGERGARLAAQSHAAAIDCVERIVGDEQIDCEFERLDGYLFVPPGESKDCLQNELEAAHRAGLVDIEMVDRAPIKDFNTGSCLHFPRQAQFHPLKYLSGVAAAVRRSGGQIFTRSHATTITGGETARVETTGGAVVTADAVVVATNTPVNDRFVIHTKQAPYITYVIGVRVPANTITRALFWDTPNPYHYIRLESLADHDVLIVGGEDHKTGQADDPKKPYAALEQWTRERFPEVGEIEFQWSGQVMEPVDGLAFIGPNPLDDDNVFIATGDSGNGMTHGTIAGMLLTDLINGRENEWASLYDPSRKTLRALKDFASENINVAVQYTDLATPGDVGSPEDIQKGTGAVVRRGLKKVAAYRDEAGAIHERSAVCPHLGCIVDWNTTEKTWDCPCHGSRFDAYGKVFQGPANRDLE